MNQITAAGIALVKRFEGFRPEPYADAAGELTVGYGHVVLPGERFTTVPEAQAGNLLVADLARFGTYVLNHITAPLTDNQFSALVSLTFNAGTAPLAGTLGTKLNALDYDGAANEFNRWVYCDGHKLPGLVARRMAEKALFNTPTEGAAPDA